MDNNQKPQQPKKGGRGPKQMPKLPKNMKKPQNGPFRSFVIALFVLVVFSALLSLYNSPLDQAEEVGINEIAQKVQQNEVKEITVIEGSKLEVVLNDEAETKLESNKEFTDSLPALLETYGVTPEQLQAVSITVQGTAAWKTVIFDVLPIAGTILLVIFFFMMMRQVQGGNNKAMSFGQSNTKMADPNQKKRTTFADVAGQEEAKEELAEVVDFLKNPKKYAAIGARIPRGVLMMGNPGTGKTLLARAVAGEAKVPFFHMSGSEFVEMFVGVGASRVRDIFKKAKKAAPAILFIDEIDAVGRQRGTGMGGSHDEREQTLNQILTEMDGFDNDTNIIVIAATNRPDVLDPALMRPGRFDRQVMLGLPDIKDREAILNVHAKNKMLEEDVHLKTIAQRTTGFSGADLMNVLNEAAIFAARHNRKKVRMADCLEAIDKTLMGPQRKSRRMNEKEKEITAYHEAGHALVAHILPESDPVHKITIIPRGRAGGYTLKLPEEDKNYHSQGMMLADIAVSFGGYIAEKMIVGDVSTGPSNDLEKATKMAQRIVMRYGMSEELGTRTFGETSEMVFLGKEIHEQRDYSESTAQRIDAAVEKIIREQYAVAEKLMTDNRDKLELIATTLLDIETLERDQFEALMDGKPLPENAQKKEEVQAEEKTAEPVEATEAPQSESPKTE